LEPVNPAGAPIWQVYANPWNGIVEMARLEIRVKGLPRDVEEATRLLGEVFHVESFSRPKPCAENNGLVHRFVTVVVEARK